MHNPPQRPEVLYTKLHTPQHCQILHYDHLWMIIYDHMIIFGCFLILANVYSSLTSINFGHIFLALHQQEEERLNMHFR